MQVTWSVIKTFATDKQLSIQYIDLGDSYFLKLCDGSFILDCNLIKDGNSDVLDFETNFKNAGNKTIQKLNNQGYVVVSPTFEDAQGLTTIWKGHLYTAPPSSISIFDVLVTTQLKLRGGWYKLMTDATLGDYVEFSIVDKDNILGLFHYFGLTVGVGVLELKKFIRTEYVSPESRDRQDFQSAGASEIMAGLYFRTQYHNTGSNPVTFSITEKYHET